ncbi:MAG: CRISPR-associated endonuclease Cas1, partial [Conexivisphaera sp.]
MLHGPIGWPAHDHPTPIYAEGSVTVKAGAARLLMRRGIPVHFLGRDGSYLGTLWP